MTDGGELDLRFFATFREAVGRKHVAYAFDGERVRLGDVIDELEATYPELDVLDDDGEVHRFVRILRNGQAVEHLDGLETEAADGDRVSIFPPVAGG